MAGYVGTKAVLLSTTAATVGGSASVGAGLTVDNDGATVLTVDRATSDGTIIDLQKSGSSVGSIGVGQSSDLYIGTSDTGILTSSSESITPWNPSTNAGRDDAIDLGTSDHRFQDLYLSGGVYLGGIGSANKLDDYETGSWTPYLAGVTAGIVYSAQAGTYTKIGSVVTISFVISVSTAPSAGGNIRIPLPFNSKGSTYTYMHGGALNVLSGLNLTDDQKSQVRLSPYQSGVDAYLYNVATGGVWNGLSTFTTGSIAGSITYEVA